MSYEIADEPSPSEGLGNLVYNPSGPLLATMVCGAWLAWPWFIVNSIAIGSPTQRREIQMCVLGILGSALGAFVVYGLVDAGIIESTFALQLSLLGITTWKLGVAYAVSKVQGRTFHVYTYYGGSAQNAFWVILVGNYVRDFVVGFSASPIWKVIVS